MSTAKEVFFERTINSLIVADINPMDIEKIRTILAINLGDFDVTDRCTDLVVHGDNDCEQILKLYVGTLLSEGKRKSTVKGYYDAIVRFQNEINKPLIKVTALDIRGWLGKKQTEVSHTTYSNYRNYLSSFYSWLYEEDIISDNPMKKISAYKEKRVVKIPFSDCEVDKIRYGCTTKRQRAIIEVLLSSGIRANELCMLDVSDINFHTLEVFIRDGKGGQQRVVYINRVAALHLQEYLKTRVDNDPALFYTRNHHRLTKTTLGEDLRAVGNDVGVNKINAHRFRHTFASNAIKKGMDIRTLQKLLGHTNLTTTQRYVHLDNEHTKLQYQQYC